VTAAILVSPAGLKTETCVLNNFSDFLLSPHFSYEMFYFNNMVNIPSKLWIFKIIVPVGENFI